MQDVYLAMVLDDDSPYCVGVFEGKGDALERAEAYQRHGYVAWVRTEPLLPYTGDAE